MAVSASAAIVLPCRAGFSPALTLAAVASERCTALYGVPTMFIAELALPGVHDGFSVSGVLRWVHETHVSHLTRPSHLALQCSLFTPDFPELGSYDLSSLRTGIMAGSLCPPDVMRRVHRELGMTQVTIESMG